jgi:sulfoxide reductase heme-binding subunit YedZ
MNANEIPASGALPWVESAGRKRVCPKSMRLMTRTLLKPLVFLLCLVPLAALAWRASADLLGANPIEEITHYTGEWTLRFLLLTLLMTPLRRFSGWGWPVRLRRMLGLFAFFYASLHLATYLWLDQFFLWGEIWLDILDRPFITVGMLAFVLLLPLALTSNRAMSRRLGKNWKRLHRLAYVIPVLGVLHFWWLVKADVLEPFVYAVLLAGLLLARVRIPRAPVPSR